MRILQRLALKHSTYERKIFKANTLILHVYLFTALDPIESGALAVYTNYKHNPSSSLVNN